MYSPLLEELIAVAERRPVRLGARRTAGPREPSARLQFSALDASGPGALVPATPAADRGRDKASSKSGLRRPQAPTWLLRGIRLVAQSHAR